MILSYLAYDPGACGPASSTVLNVQLQLLVSGLAQPVYLTHAGDGSARLFIVEQTGVIRIFKNGSLLPTPFLDIIGRVLSGGEQGQPVPGDRQRERAAQTIGR